MAESSIEALGVPLIAGATVRDGIPTTKLDDVRDTIWTEPNVLLAITASRKYFPTSAHVGVYEALLAPSMAAQPDSASASAVVRVSAASHRYHCGVVVGAGDPVAAGIVPANDAPTAGLAPTVGAADMAAVAPTAKVGPDVHVAAPATLLALNFSRRYLPTSAATGWYVEDVAEAILLHELVAVLFVHRSHWCVSEVPLPQVPFELHIG